jgi:hypothetical protein
LLTNLIGVDPMRFAIAVAATLALAAPTLAQAASADPSNDPTARPTAPSAEATTTPGTRRAGDADLRSSNRKGGTGGRNSSSNGS